MNHVTIYKIQLMKAGTIPIENAYIHSVDDAEGVCRRFLQHEYGGCYPDREVFGAVWLNIKNEVVGFEVVSIGTLNAGLVHPREVFKSGILHNAASLIVFHNHPSGDVSPSQQDAQVTQRLAEAGGLIGIELLDHVILGENACYSMKASGLM